MLAQDLTCSCILLCMNKLTVEEATTLHAYNTSPQQWANQHDDLDFWKEEYAAFSRFLPNGKVIDVGAGAGRDAHFFLSRPEYEYLGVDLSSEAVKTAQTAHPTGRFQEANLYDLSGLDMTFDGLWCAAVLIHIPKRRTVEALQAMTSVLRTKGIGMIATKLGEGEKLEAWSVNPSESRLIVRYTRDELASALEDSELSVLWENVVSKHGSDWQSFIVQKH